MRQRVVARARLFAFLGVLVVVGLALVLSWVLSRMLASPSSTLSLDIAYVAAFLALVVLAWVFAYRSTRVVEELFLQEDRLMLAAVHEGNRPLSRLVAAVDEGLSGRVPVDVALLEVSNHADVLRDLIDALLEMARVATGAVELTEEVLRLDEVVVDVERTKASSSATLLFDLHPTVVTGSPRLLCLAVENLVRNAARHGYHDGPGEIRIRVDECGVTVTDDGPGMDPSLLAKLCAGGTWTGLRLDRVRFGLAVVGWVSEIHGGRLVLVNRPEGGFTASMVLPVTSDAIPETGDP